MPLRSSCRATFWFNIWKNSPCSFPSPFLWNSCATYSPFFTQPGRIPALNLEGYRELPLACPVCICSCLCEPHDCSPARSPSLRLSSELSMQSSEGAADSPASVALCSSAATQAPVAQPVPASPQVTDQPGKIIVASVVASTVVLKSTWLSREESVFSWIAFLAPRLQLLK